MSRLGFHVGGDLNSLREGVRILKENNLEVIQIHIGNPVRVDFPKPNVELEEIVKGLKVIIHSPYWVSCFNDRVVNLNIAYVNRIFDTFDIKDMLYLTHPGTPLRDMGSEEIKEKLHTFLNKILNGNDSRVKIMFENVPGKGYLKGVSMSVLNDVVRDFPNAGIAFDTEHLFASGEEWGVVDWNLVKVVHLNGIPCYVKKGGGLDRHSLLPFYQGKSDVFEIVDKLKSLDSDVWIVMERRDLTISLGDALEVRKKLNGNDKSLKF